MEVKTLTITNFGGPLTRRDTGKLDSGSAKYETSWGYDPYSEPGNLTWMEQPTSILTGGPIVAVKSAVGGVGGIMYAVSKGGGLYNITVNTNSNPNADSPSVIGMMPDTNFDRAAAMELYGGPEKIFVGSDLAIQRVDTTGANASIIGTFSSQARPMAKFLGKLYFGAGDNIGEIDSTLAITTAAKLSPSLPSGLFVRDLDTTPDGNYLQITASRANTPNVILDPLDSISFLSTDSYKFYWNGVDASFSAFDSYPGMVLSASVVRARGDFDFGYDSNGAGIFSESQKKVSLPEVPLPNRNAAFSAGNMLGFAVPEYEKSSTRFRAAVFHYGQYDDEIPSGLFRLLRQNAAVEDDIMAVPICVNVSNRQYIPQFYNLPNNIIGNAKLYYSTQEGDATSSVFAQKLWRFNTVPTGVGSIVAGVYETQTELFSKKIAVKEVRLYTKPLVPNNSFTIDLIGSGGSVISGGSQIFTVGTNVTAGQDMVQFNPVSAPTYALGLRITNSSVIGTKNWSGVKMEVDIADAGK